MCSTANVLALYQISLLIDQVSLQRSTLASSVPFFYSAIFKVMSSKFQTFTYYSRTVWSNYMEFWMQFEINELYVCAKFRANNSRDFGFRTRKPS